ncbi:MAG: hypothetical protein GX659_07085 [Myxococcales bacterium]|nr:hypothetical protein [Myxococcales bacterium]
MKNRKLKIFIPLIISSALAILAIPPSICHGMAKKHSESAKFEESPGWNKIDLRMKTAWKEAESEGKRSKMLECIIKTEEKPDKDGRELLKRAGFKTRTFIGRIVTGSVAAGDLPMVANLEMVEIMELAAPMSLKKKK